MNLLIGIVIGFALFIFADLALDWISPIHPIGPIRPFKNLPRK